MKTLLLFFAGAAVALGCSDDSNAADGGQDATATDGSGDASPDAPGDASADVAADTAADAPLDSATDASADATPDADADTCGGGCVLFSYECANTNLPPCTCLSLSASDPKPVCDAGTANCFKDPCVGKTAACVSGSCTVQ